MQSIQDAVSLFSQGTRMLEASMGRVADCWNQMEQNHSAQRTAEERWRHMEQRLETMMEERWRQLEERLKTMVMKRMEALVIQRMEALVIQRMQMMVAEGVEAKFGERLQRVEQKLRDREGDRETGEASPDISGTEERLSSEGVGARVAALEVSVQKALEIMFPRVEALLVQLEGQPLLKHPMRPQPQLRVALPNLPSARSTPQSPQSPLRPPSTNTSPTSILPPPQFHSSSHGVCSSDILIRAAKEGRREEVCAQLDGGSPINSCDSYGNTALYWAAFGGHTSTLTLLLERGADVNCRNIEGWTPLHAAARWGFTPFISLLLDAGAAIECKTETGRTPLHVAANSGREQTVQALLVEGAQIQARDNNRRTPLDLANSSAVRRLLRR